MHRLAELLRYRVRSLLRAKAHSIAIILTFALGLGANTAMFSLIDTVLLRPLRFADESRLMAVGFQTRGGRSATDGDPYWQAFSNDIAAWYRSASSVSGIAAYAETRRVVVGQAQAEYAVGGSVTAELPRVIGTRAILGRWFTPQENFSRVVVISRSLWLRQFAGDSSVLGRPLSIQQSSYTVIGVVDDDAALPLGAEFWVPDNTIGGSVVARLRDGATASRAAQELTRLSPSVVNMRRFGESRSVIIAPLHDRLFGSVRPILALLMAASITLLLIACANVASLSLARTLERRRELAIRATLGASRPMLGAIVVGENLLLALLGVAAGMILGTWTTHFAITYLPEALRPRASAGPGRGAILYGTAMAALGALAVSVAPIVLIIDGNVARFLNYSGGRSGRGRASRRVRQLLVAGQLAMSLAFVTSAALLIQSIERLTRPDRLGFNPEGVTVVSLPLWGPRFMNGDYGADVLRRFVDRVRALPSTRTVGIGPAPLVGGRGEGLREGFDAIFTFVDTVTRQRPGQTVWLKWVDPGYFATYGVRLRAGRLLTTNDDPSSERVVVISKRASQLFFGDRNPVGQALPHQIPIDSLKVARVVGVIDDELQRDLSIDAAPEILAPIAQARRPSPNPTIAVRSTDAPSKVVADLRAALRATDPQVAAARLEPMTAIVNRSLATHRLLVGMLASFGVLAVLIAVVGVYGLVAYFVAQREHEMGVRLALGAQRANVLRMMLAEGGRIVLLGVAVGWALAIGAGRLIASVAFDVHPANITTFVCAGGVLAIVAMAAVFVPSRRAATLDPAMTLRAE